MTQKTKLSYICGKALLDECNLFVTRMRLPLLWQIQPGLCTGLLVLTDGQENLPPSPSPLLNTHPDIYVLFTQGRQSCLEGCLKFVKTRFISRRFDGSSRSQGMSWFHGLKWQTRVGWGHAHGYGKDFTGVNGAASLRWGVKGWDISSAGMILMVRWGMDTPVQTIRSFCLILKNYFESAGGQISILHSSHLEEFCQKFAFVSLSAVGFCRGSGK